MLTPPEKIPQFSLLDQDGRTRTTQDYAKQWLVVYFYPKDDTPGCTQEACSFRDTWQSFAEHGVHVVGISKDSVRSHKKFQEKYQLPFELLSDPTAATIKAFGAWGKKKFMGREFDGILRTTFLITPQSEVAKVYQDVTPAEHAPAIIADLEQLQK